VNEGEKDSRYQACYCKDDTSPKLVFVAVIESASPERPNGERGCLQSEQPMEAAVWPCTPNEDGKGNSQHGNDE
jgi:hypothetical protein